MTERIRVWSATTVAWLCRRPWMATATLALALTTQPAQAGSYLYRSALLLAHANRDSAALQKRPWDRELAVVIRTMAEARLRAAGSMGVPKEVVLAHPHLLLVLESQERAADAASRGARDTYLRYARRAWDEQQVLHAVLKQLGWLLPEL